jgi:hypothetical protein
MTRGSGIENPRNCRDGLWPFTGRFVIPRSGSSQSAAETSRQPEQRGWHLAVCVTDLPLQTARRPVIAHVSATHGVAVLSMPALGPVSVRKRTAETIVRLVGHILGDLAPAADAAPLAQAMTRRMRELGGRTKRGERGVGFVARVFTGNIWLLLGMLVRGYETLRLTGSAIAGQPRRLPARVTAD